MAFWKFLISCLVVVVVTLAPVLCDILDGVCQTGGGNTSITYQACAPAASALTRSAPFNLTIIPESATCGDPPTTFCSKTWQFGCLEFDTCDRNNPDKSHPKDFLVDDSMETYWASISASSRNELKVVIQLSFDKLYELSGTIALLFFSGRPREMIIEKSIDHGASWTVLQYYSQDCTKYSGVARSKGDLTTTNPTAVICTGDYTTAEPYTGGIVKFDDRHLMFLGPTLSDYQNLFNALENDPNFHTFLSFTGIRITLLIPPAQGGFYGISNIDISGKCSCNLHASSCSLVNGFTVCNCSHNTEGKDCERCLPMYNERPWKRGSYLGEANECQKCECNEHAQSCTYDPVYMRGVCDNCFHHTKGFHCQECIDGYYHNTSLPLNDLNTCTLCDCEPLGVTQGSVGCSQTPDGDKPIGQCPCKPQITGRRCDVCVDGFYGLLVGDQPGECKPCNCNTRGTVGGSTTCNKETGQCPCKPSTDGRLCSVCKPGYHGFPLDVTQECTACGCDWGGSMSEVCDAVSGECNCRDKVQGVKCSQPEPGTYFPFLDVNALDPVSGTCTLDSAMQSTLSHDGQSFARCQSSQSVVFADVAGQIRQPQIQWPYRLAVRYSHNSQLPWPSGTLTVTTSRISGITDTSEYLSKQTEPINTSLCTGIGQTKTWTVDFQPGSGVAWLSSVGDEVILDVRCQYRFTLVVGQKDLNEVNDDIVIDSIVPLPSLSQYPSYRSADNETKLQYDECVTNVAALSTRSQHVQSPTCRALSFSVGTQINLGASDCGCDQVGTQLGTQCNGFGGECACKPGVAGRTCNTCDLGYYNFTDSGCTACNCDQTGSQNGVCDIRTGQCPCHTNVARYGEITRDDVVAGTLCNVCKVNHYGFAEGSGCLPCNCSSLGSQKQQCDEEGQCTCKDTITGLQCDVCEPGYYNFTVTGCLACDCTSDGVVSSDCNKDTGVCTCRTNVMGDRCDQCKPGYFNLLHSDPNGCQKCFCYEHGTPCTSAGGFVEAFVFTESTQFWEVASSFDSNYIMAPTEFLAYQARSYNQPLSFEMMTGSGSVQLSGRRPIILESQGVQIHSQQDEEITSLEVTTITISLHEDYWYYSNDTQVTSSHMQRTLADLQAIYVRKLYDPVIVTVRNFQMKSAAEAIEGDGRPPVGYVEQCSCEPAQGVTGLSCETCSEGNRRPTNTSSRFESCVPCDCNDKQDGAAILCNETTGECLNCRNGTEGLNCEKCAPNVVDSSECDVCMDNYWGLFKEGCIACNCNDIGTIAATICEKSTGKCSCKDHVTGRQCDVCQDNYFNLTSAGCTVCDDCYVLVETEVNELRQMRDNLTSHVQVLKDNDKNAELGRFTERLNKAVTDLNDLQQFVDDAKNMEVTTADTLSDLNATLIILLADLEGNTAIVATIASELRQARVNVDVSKGAVNAIKGTVNTALMQLEALRLESRKITDLVNTLVSMNQEFSTMAGATANELQRLDGEVSAIENVVTDANNVSSASLEMATQTSNALGAVTSRVGALQASVNQLNSLVTMINSSAAGSLTRVKDQTDSFTAINEQVANLAVPSESVAKNLQSQASQIRQSAQSLREQALENAQSTTLTSQVSRAVTQSADLLGNIRVVLSTSEILLEQVRSAAVRAEEAATMASNAFTAAEDMRSTLLSFSAIIADLKQQAQNSLNTVMEIRNLSEAAIQTAQALREQLRVAFNNAQLAHQQMMTAEALQRSKRDALSPVNDLANQLQTDSSGVLNDLETQAGRIIAANSTYVQVGDSTCKSEQPLLSEARNSSEAAKLKAQEAFTKVSITKDRAESLLQSLQNLQEIDVARIQQLKDEIQANREYFDQRQLAAVVTELRNKVQAQKDWIDSAVVRKEQLQLDIQNLRATQSQLVHN
ncbi:laminin subunit gamma-1-like [Liolophura sinensis]|uniref:laminin subunit gamma-1-like n=1 Tax=Liolophura sinensis TaxID=3198878 RepID=UPI0031582E7B